MSRLRVQSFSVSIDGFGAGPNQSIDNPMGMGGMALHDWAFTTRTFRQMLVILEKNVRDSRAIWQALWQGFRMPPFAADDLIRQARRYKSRRELTRALRLIARADLELRSSPPDKRLVLERLVYDLASEPKPTLPAWASAQLSFES